MYGDGQGVNVSSDRSVSEVAYRNAREDDIDGYWAVYMTGYPFVDRWDETTFRRVWEQGKSWEQGVVGVARGSIVAIGSVIALGDLPYMMAVVVHHDWRGIGVGKGIIAHAETIAREYYQADRVAISVMISNYAALALYNTLGFEMLSLLVLVSGMLTPVEEPDLSFSTRNSTEEDWQQVAKMNISSPFASMTEEDWRRLSEQSVGKIVESEGKIVGYYSTYSGEVIEEINSFSFIQGAEEIVMLALASELAGKQMAIYVDVRQNRLLELTREIGLVQDSFLTEVFMEKQFQQIPIDQQEEP